MMTAQQIKQEFLLQADPQKALGMQRFFKTGKGEYGEGDLFIGLTSQQIRDLVKKHKTLEISEIEKLLNDEYHECRSVALAFLVNMFQKTKSETERKMMYQFYMSQTDRINNWDLVDISCAEIVGRYLFDKPKDDLYVFAKSGHLWRERIAIISTMYFIRNQQFDDTLAIAEILLHHPHDLIHKAVGWMLREVGKRNLQVERNFLLKHYKTMPRTMLRYAIEKFEESDRRGFLKGEIND